MSRIRRTLHACVLLTSIVVLALAPATATAAPLAWQSIDLVLHEGEIGDVSPAEQTSHLDVAEAEAIVAALHATEGRLERTANELGVSRTTLWRKMKKHGIKAEKFRSKSK